MKMFRFVVALLALTAFAFSGVALAADMYYVVKDQAGNMKVVDKKPEDASKIVKGPFQSKAQAKQAMDKGKKMK